MNSLKRISGITLLELMLVLAVGIVFILMGFRQYQLLQRDYAARQMIATVDGLFQAAKHYYHANCRQSSGSGADQVTLDPGQDNFAPVVNVLPSQLKMNGYFDMDWPPTPNGWVDTSYGSGGYNVIFILYQLKKMHDPQSVYFNWTTPSASTPVAWDNSISPGRVYSWTIHVVVKLHDGVNATTYKDRLDADCSSDDPTIRQCETATPGQYLIWQRLPSFAAKNITTPLWVTMPRIKQFRNLYTNDDMYGASNQQFADRPANPASSTLGNDYLCGE